MSTLKWTRKKGFSLIELLLVVAIIGIISALVLLNGSASETVDVQTESKNVIKALQSIRSGWLAYYAERQEFLGLPASEDVNEFAANSPFVRSLEIYIDRDIEKDIAKYGNVMFCKKTKLGITSAYLGFTGNWQFRTGLEDAIENSLAHNANGFGLLSRNGGNYETFAHSQGGNGIMMRVY